MDVPTLLQLLRNVPVETFREHASETISTIKHILLLLHVSPKNSETTPLPVGSHSNHALNGEEPSAIANSVDTEHNIPHSEGDLAPIQQHGVGQSRFRSETGSATRKKSSQEKDRPSDLFKEIENSFSRLSDIHNKRPADIIAQKRVDKRDKRLDHILRLENNTGKVATTEDNLLRGIAQRSLALDYSRHEAKLGKTGRVDEICQFLSNPELSRKGIHSRRGGKFRHWAKQNLVFAEKDENIVSSAISAGVKQLAVEEQLRRKLREQGLSLKTSGISLVTALSHQNFKNLKLEQIQPLIDLVIADKSGINESNGMLQRIDQISPWFENFQNEYDSGYLGLF